MCLCNYQVYSLSKGNRVPLGGMSCMGNVYIFSSSWNTDESVSSTVVHEIGHLFRQYYLSDDDLEAYMTSRGVKNGSLLHGVASVKGELFAEDFRVLFGDERAQVNMYSFYNTVKPPTEKDREFILKLAGKQTALASEGSLDHGGTD